MSAQPEFQAEVFHNEYLPDGARTVDAVVTVTCSSGTGDSPPAGSGGSGGPPSAAQVIMVDCSGSMGYPATKMTQARKATAIAVDTLRDGVAFAVVAGTSRARLVYPATPQLAPANPETRAQAKAAVASLRADGGTAIGTWLTMAYHLFRRHEADLKHAILLTDGRNEHESRETLQRTLAACEGQFICDCRGVGAGWVADELRLISSTLLGEADGLEDPGQLPASFRAMTERAMGKSIVDVKLRVWTPAGATLCFVKQVFPQVEDLTGRRSEVSTRVGEYPTGAWGEESRDYHLSIEVPAGTVGDELLAARVGLTSGGQLLTERLLLARWTDDTALSTRISPQVAHYTGQAELAAMIQDGLAARDAGDLDSATAKLGRAVQIATESGHTDTAKLLARIVDVVDAESGTVRLKKKIDGADAEIANVRSVKTIRVKKAETGKKAEN